jgi:large subunit ribosomal protein L18
MKSISKSQKRDRRHKRVRAKVVGTAERPRLSIFKSNKRIVAQIIDDGAGVTLAAVSSSGESGKTPREKAESAGATLAKKAGERGVKKVTFDRGGYQYIGTISAFADAARKAGLDF